VRKPHGKEGEVDEPLLSGELCFEGFDCRLLGLEGGLEGGLRSAGGNEKGKGENRLRSQSFVLLERRQQRSTSHDVVRRIHFKQRTKERSDARSSSQPLPPFQPIPIRSRLLSPSRLVVGRSWGGEEPGG
jgi:hypothetical protein